MSVARIAVLLMLSVMSSVRVSHAATAAPPVYTIGDLGVGGSGCPPQNVTVEPSADGTGVSVIFSSFNVSTDATNLRVRAACGIGLPIHAQSGQSVGFFKVDFRGHVYVPNEPDAAAVLTNEYFFFGQQGIKFQSAIWSPCGGSTVFRVNTAVAASRPESAKEEVKIVLDSTDSGVRGSIQVAVASRACDSLTGEPI